MFASERIRNVAKACEMEFDKAFSKANNEERDRFELLRKTHVDVYFKEAYRENL